MLYKKYDRTWFQISCHKGHMCYEIQVPLSIIAGYKPGKMPFEECAGLLEGEDKLFSAWMLASSPEEALTKAWKYWSEIHNGAAVPPEGFPAIATENILLGPESYDWCVKHLKGFAKKVRRKG